MNASPLRGGFATSRFDFLHLREGDASLYAEQFGTESRMALDVGTGIARIPDDETCQALQADHGICRLSIRSGFEARDLDAEEESQEE